MKFENNISIGNILTMLAMVAGMFWSYSRLQAEQVRQADKIENLQISARDMIALNDARSVATDARLRLLEIAQASQSSDLKNILATVTEIKDVVGRIKDNP